MADKYQLSEGSLRVIMSGGKVEDAIMQVLGTKRIASGSSSDKERYRLLLSDGKYLISFAMLTTQNNDKIVNGELSDNSIIKIKKYITSVINNVGKVNKRVLVILEMETLVPGHKSSKIGSPEQLPEDDSEPLPSETKNNTVSSSTSSTVPQVNGSHRNDTDVNMSMQDQLTHPISSLSPYQNKWVIKARVSNKSSIRTWSNSRGEGKLFNMDLIDESGEIRATAFRDLVDKFYDLIEVDKVYYISKCQLKIANKQFSNLNNDYEMTFTPDTIVQECHDVVDSIPQTRYDFISIDKIAHIEVDTMIDVIGVCKSASDVQMFQARSTGRDLKKRELTLVDQSNNSIALTLWGTEAETFDSASQPVIVIKGARVSQFGGGKTLSTNASTVMKINPDIPEAHRLRGWFDNEGISKTTVNISARSEGGGSQTQWINVKDVQEMGMGQGDKGDYFQVVGTILLYRSENGIYKACPKEDCKKKAADQGNGMYRCDKCNREYPNFKYLLLGSANIADWSGNIWLSLFSSEAEKVLGMSSQAVGEAIENDSQALVEIADKAHFKEFIFKCRSKMENYNDENRLKTVALRVEPVNFKEYNSYLISQINQLLN
ncbi:hypothetical protein PPYR_10350 [Photinus pyralis]|uniref:Replication protein A subunit n=1 Tax=Photinus pyralis TaxID=7054 RepID=A0A5N4AG62_PHOPY|nr:replication protein A 70 kDa DNA-binding subunit-like isoform X1 [Photinus pyralis]XP_031348024.1 replication protein A 70 kDa DNA-binding subunit-like [Photinus pyralis]KAB0796289.1 hypothetical protein PPYR_10350 [Photinus pyralis]